MIAKKQEYTPNHARLYPKRWHPYFYVLRSLTNRIENILEQKILPKISHPTLLDMGCGTMPYKLILEPHSKYIGIDLIDNQEAHIHFLSDGTVPLPDGYTDIILSTQVLEHVTSPSVYLSECYRLVKPQGFMILSTHGYWCYHPTPTDFWRWTGAGLAKIVRDAGFQIVECQGIMSLAATSIQLLQFSIDRAIPRSRLFKASFYLVMQFLVQLFDRVFPGERTMDSCVFVILATK